MLHTLLSPTVFIEPSQNIPNLEKQIERVHQQHPFTFVIDLTSGQLIQRISLLQAIPHCTQIKISRIREATSIDLPTSGHLMSHNVEEIWGLLNNQDLSHVLVLDDTSFSGTTSLLVEKQVQDAFPGRKISFTHGFLILNTGKLGTNPGAKEQLRKNGSHSISGMQMHTPKEDGWHFFDMVHQDHIEQHLLIVAEILKILQEERFVQLVGALLSREETVRLMFPQILAADELNGLQKTGHFLTKRAISGGFHVRNPQLMPNIIQQHHLLHPEQWNTSQQEVFALLIQLNRLLQKGTV